MVSNINILSEQRGSGIIRLCVEWREHAGLHWFKWIMLQLFIICVYLKGSELLQRDSRSMMIDSFIVLILGACWLVHLVYALPLL